MILAIFYVTNGLGPIFEFFYNKCFMASLALLLASHAGLFRLYHPSWFTLVAQLDHIFFYSNSYREELKMEWEASGNYYKDKPSLFRSNVERFIIDIISLTRNLEIFFIVFVMPARTLYTNGYSLSLLFGNVFEDPICTDMLHLTYSTPTVGLLFFRITESQWVVTITFGHYLDILITVLYG